MQGNATLNFIELGKTAGMAGPSILGVVVHPRFGPWIAFRAAILIDQAIDEPGEALALRSVSELHREELHSRLSHRRGAYPGGWDIPRCLAYRIESEPDCTPRCHARAGCVIGPEHRYPDDELAYHQKRALGAMRPWYEKNLKPSRRQD